MAILEEDESHLVTDMCYTLNDQIYPIAIERKYCERIVGPSVRLATVLLLPSF